MRSSTTIAVFLFFTLTLTLVSCSGGKSPLDPSINGVLQDQSSASSNENREIIAVYDVTIDELSGT